MLLLKRVNSPQTLAPPGGRLNIEEDPLAGLRREILEETGLDVSLIGMAHVWFGSMDGRQPTLLCMNFLAESESDAVRLSGEHNDFVWADEEQIRSGEITTLTADGYGYKPEELLESFSRYRALKHRLANS